MQYYARLTPLTRFADAADFSRYSPAPDDWTVIVCDITGSTAAIEAGRYKQVNMIGAAGITAALNAVSASGIATDIAYVFGGDGASLLVPAAVQRPVLTALTAVQQRATRVFSLDLRVGFVPVRQLHERGAPVLAARLRLSPGNDLALFAGGGFSLADRLIKTDPSTCLPPDDNAPPPDLTNLSCRWEPLKPAGGRIATVLISARGQNTAERAAAYRTTLTAMEQAIGKLAARAPANEASLRFRWPPRNTALEARTLDGRATPRRMIWVLFQAFWQKLGHRFSKTFGEYDAPRYKEELKANTDFRRFDDMLRLVLDCTPEQVEKLRAALDDLEAGGHVFYGLHTASHALMTCLVFDLRASRHMHFIDGGDGGFTLAAQQLKQKR